MGPPEVMAQLARTGVSMVRVPEVPGFKTFSLLKGPQHEDHVLYASHSVWASKDAFQAWTESEAFRKAHAQASAPKGTYLGHPDLETFEAVL